jgi:hypothetical protein
MTKWITIIASILMLSCVPEVNRDVYLRYINHEMIDGVLSKYTQSNSVLTIIFTNAVGSSFSIQGYEKYPTNRINYFMSIAIVDVLILERGLKATNNPHIITLYYSNELTNMIRELQKVETNIRRRWLFGYNEVFDSNYNHVRYEELRVINVEVEK